MQTAKYPEVRSAYRSARLRAGISQERLAGETGTTRRHIIRIENGEHRPTPGLRDRIADVLGVAPDTLPSCEAVVSPFVRTRSETGS